MASEKKRKSESGNSFVATGKRSNEELEAELLETKAELLDTKAELLDTKAELSETKQKLLEAESKIGAPQNEDDDLSDGEESLELDSKDPWISKYLELREYRIVNGHCKVPQKFATNPKLGKWVDNQKLAYANVKHGKKGLRISEERITRLNGLGFDWGRKFPAPVSWDERFEELQKFQKAMGHCNIHIHPSNPSPLAQWVSAQRSEYKRFRKGRESLLTPEQIGQLKGIGFKWKGPGLP